MNTATNYNEANEEAAAEAEAEEDRYGIYISPSLEDRTMYADPQGR